MKLKTKSLIALATASLTTVAAHAAPTLDGSKDAAYGSALAVQTVNTGFGNASNGANNANGSELDAAYAVIEGNTLYVLFTGNLETNFNKLNVYLQTKSGGVNVVQSGFNNPFANLAGLTLDAGFNANYIYSVTSGNAPNNVYVDAADLNASQSGYAGETTIGGPTTLTGGSFLTDLGIAINNTNTAGVGGTPGDPVDSGAAAAVTTGIELALNLTALGYTSGDITIAAMINNGDNNYLSNQILGGLPATTGNLGGNGSGGFTGTVSGVNFNNFAGNQFFVVPAAVVPEPAFMSLIGVPALAMLARRRVSN